MKKTILIALLFIPIIGYTQTTIEEWNYVTKGYKIQMESGLDMKKGYHITDAGKYTYNGSDAVRTINFKRLIRTESNVVCAIIVEYIRKDNRNSSVMYFCIPHKLSSQEIWNLSNAQVETFDGEFIGKAFTQALFRFISHNDL